MLRFLGRQLLSLRLLGVPDEHALDPIGRLLTVLGFGEVEKVADIDVFEILGELSPAGAVELEELKRCLLILFPPARVWGRY